MIVFTTAWITKKGYRRGRIANYPYPRKCGLIYEHIAVMETELGRRLEGWEHVHHLDENKLHNVRSNLEIREASGHSRYHTGRQRRKPNGHFIPARELPDDPPF